MIAAPRLIRRNSMKCDPGMIKIAQHFHCLGFMRAVANIDADSFAFDQRRDQLTQRRHHSIERSRETDPLPPRPREPRRFMPLPFRRHPVTEFSRSLFTHPATVEAGSAGCQPVRLGSLLRHSMNSKIRGADLCSEGCRTSAPARRISNGRQERLPHNSRIFRNDVNCADLKWKNRVNPPARS